MKFFLKSSEKLWISDDFRSNRRYLIRSDSLKIVVPSAPFLYPLRKGALGTNGLILKVKFATNRDMDSKNYRLMARMSSKLLRILILNAALNYSKLITKTPERSQLNLFMYLYY